MRSKKKIAGIVVGLFFLIGLIGSLSESPNKPSAEAETSNIQATSVPQVANATDRIEDTTAPNNPNIVHKKVSRVVDGDTFELESGERVRLIGIDTPETPNECYSQEATEKLKELIGTSTVGLEKDVSETDRYGRLLRYVYMGDLLINDVLVRQGFANASSYPPDVKYQEQFTAAEREARENERGLWGDVCQATPKPTVKAVSTVTPVVAPVTGSCKYSCTGADKDCSDFSTHAEAQAFFECCGFTATNDPMRLDGVKVDDGIACESLP